jgi:hypothetical protein
MFIKWLRRGMQIGFRAKKPGASLCSTVDVTLVETRGPRALCVAYQFY